MVGERIKKAMNSKKVRKRLEGKPPLRRLEEEYGFQDRATRLRNRPGKRLTEGVPKPEHRNVGGGQFVGAIEAMTATILEDVIGVPFGGSSDVINVEKADDGNGYIYTVNTNAPTMNMAQAKAFIDASTGYTSFFTDEYDVEEIEVIGSRTLRDTHQIKLRVKD